MSNIPRGLINAAAGIGHALGTPTFGRPDVTGLYYNGQSITLDGYRFIRCRFDRCHLWVNSLNFEIFECVVDASTVISYGPSVAKAIKLFHSRSPWAASNFPGFTPTQNVDGSITIADSD